MRDEVATAAALAGRTFDAREHTLAARLQPQLAHTLEVRPVTETALSHVSVVRFAVDESRAALAEIGKIDRFEPVGSVLGLRHPSLAGRTRKPLAPVFASVLAVLLFLAVLGFVFAPTAVAVRAPGGRAASEAGRSGGKARGGAVKSTS